MRCCQIAGSMGFLPPSPSLLNSPTSSGTGQAGCCLSSGATCQCLGFTPPSGGWPPTRPSWLWPHLWSFSAPPHHQGCYTVILNAFETYVYLAGALAIGVLAIEVSEGPHSCSSPEARHPHRVRGRHSPTACTPSLSPPPDPWLRTQWDPASGTTG